MEILQDITYTHAYWIFLLPVVGAVADIITGWIQASINGTWDSTKMRTGLYRKGGELLIVILAFIAEYALEVVAKAHVATLLSIYIVIMEALSVLENLDQAGIPIPLSLTDTNTLFLFCVVSIFITESSCENFMALSIRCVRAFFSR